MHKIMVDNFSYKINGIKVLFTVGFKPGRTESKISKNNDGQQCLIALHRPDKGDSCVDWSILYFTAKTNWICICENVFGIQWDCKIKSIKK